MRGGGDFVAGRDANSTTSKDDERVCAKSNFCFPYLLNPFFALIPRMKRAFDVELVTASHLNEERCW